MQPDNVELLSPVSLEEGQLSESDLQVIRFNTVYNASELTCCQNAEFYTSGKAHYTRLFKDLEQAKTCIFIEFYTIHHDMVGEKLVEVLTKKASEGVEVWVMCDFIANLSTPKKVFRPLEEAGVKVVRVKPYFTHYRKIVSIDQKISYIGGMNIGKTVRQYGPREKSMEGYADSSGGSMHIDFEYIFFKRLALLN